MRAVRVFFGIFGCLVVTLLVLTSVSTAQTAGGGKSQAASASTGLSGLVNVNVFSKLTKAGGKAKPKAPTGSTTSGTAKPRKTSSRPGMPAPPPAGDSTAGTVNFIPGKAKGVDLEVAKTLSSDPNDQAGFIEIFRATKQGYDQEIAARGRKNDVAMALTFFIATSLTVYHDTDEPTEEVLEVVYNAMAESLISEPGFVDSTSAEKEAMNDRLIYISGIVLAGYLKAKEDGDKAMLESYRLMAGATFQALTEMDPATVRFTAQGLESL